MKQPLSTLLIPADRTHGPRRLPDGQTLFTLWSPAQPQVSLAIEGRSQPYTMRAAGAGWLEARVAWLSEGARYQFVLPDGTRLPDPASRSQPDGVHGASELIDPNSYTWQVDGWRGRPWHTAVLYELHVGTFTPEGTFAAAIEKLDHLVLLGVTAVQIMPIGAFPGRRNWGYDGVFPYACASSYGRPNDLKRLVDEAHARGLMVLLDVVYNHFGPEGNFLSLYAPQFFTDRHKTPWGAGINFDGEQSAPVRDFFIQNAMRWIDEFRLDGLRLDAVHAIKDDSPRHFLDELVDRVRACATDRVIHLVVENEENQAELLRRDAGGPLAMTAQWNDDVHHVLHAAVTGESCGYYADYRGDTGKLGRALAEGFAFQGEMMPFRGSRRGEPSGFLPPDAFISFVQNHDQVGNRAFGDRWSKLATPAARRAAVALYLLLPQIPMLFMGEEWGSEQPFPFFCDFTGDLADAVRNGRRSEFAHLPEFSDPDALRKIPDPLSEKTFRSAALHWADVDQPRGASWLDFYQRLLDVRRAEITPLLAELEGRSTVHLERGPSAVSVRWRPRKGPTLQLDANLSGAACAFPPFEGRTVWLEGERDQKRLKRWTVHWALLDVE